VSPAIVELMESDERIMEVVRWAIVHPVVSHLGGALRFPDAPLDDVPEPWRSYLTEMRDSLEEWTGAVPLPRDFDGMPVAEAAAELAVVLRYLLRTPESRAAYLADLRDSGALPLRGTPCQMRAAASHLVQSGRLPSEVALVVTPAED
jgi:hypothetical protein